MNLKNKKDFKKQPEKKRTGKNDNRKNNNERWRKKEINR
jgi:hypothetical protein